LLKKLEKILKEAVQILDINASSSGLKWIIISIGHMLKLYKIRV
jgi:hypothetical protein